MELRAIEPDDVAAVQALIESDPSYTERVTGHPPGPADAQSLLMGRPDGLAEGAKLVLGAWLGHELAAVVDLLRGYPAPGTAYVGLLQVHAKHQRRGLGAAAYGLVERYVANEWPEIDRYRLAVIDTNADAAGFWRAMGFEPTGEAKPYRYDKLETVARLYEKGVGWSHPSLAAADSTIEGRGLFATRPVAGGTVVAVLGGRRVDTAELTRLLDDSRQPVDTITVGDDEHLVLPTDPRPTIAYGNHSCDPNLWWIDAVTLATRRDLSPGEEVTSDYGTSTGVDGYELACRCGSALCRGTVTGRDWQLPELQQRYGDHWVPLLRDRISRKDGREVRRKLRHGYTNETFGVGDVVEKTYAGPDAESRLAKEYAVLTGLQGRLPVPPVLDRSNSTLRLGFLPGVPGQELLDGERAPVVLRACGKILSRIHRTAIWSHPAGGVLVHGDFGPNNLLLDPDTFDVTAIVDWEFAHPGEPVEDLAWCEWIVRMHHPDQRAALPSFFDAYDGDVPVWEVRQAAMVSRCEELERFADRWEPDGPAVTLWRERIARTAAWTE